MNCKKLLKNLLGAAFLLTVAYVQPSDRSEQDYKEYIAQQKLYPDLTLEEFYQFYPDYQRAIAASASSALPTLQYYIRAAQQNPLYAQYQQALQDESWPAGTTFEEFVYHNSQGTKPEQEGPDGLKRPLIKGQIDKLIAQSLVGIARFTKDRGEPTVMRLMKKIEKSQSSHQKIEFLRALEYLLNDPTIDVNEVSNPSYIPDHPEIRTALLYAIHLGHPKMLSMLLQRPDLDINGSPRIECPRPLRYAIEEYIEDAVPVFEQDAISEQELNTSLDLKIINMLINDPRITHIDRYAQMAHESRDPKLIEIFEEYRKKQELLAQIQQNSAQRFDTADRLAVEDQTNALLASDRGQRHFAGNPDIPDYIGTFLRNKPVAPTNNSQPKLANANDAAVN